MIFIVWSSESFADESDRVGVVQAANIQDAIAIVQKWAEEEVEEYEELSGAEKTIGPGFAEVAFHRRLAGSSETGWDRYHIVPRENPLMFLVEDWKQIFS